MQSSFLPSPALHAVRAIDRAVIELAAERARLAAAIDAAELATTHGTDRVAELTRRSTGGLSQRQVADLLAALRDASTPRAEGGTA